MLLTAGFLILALWSLQQIINGNHKVEHYYMCNSWLFFQLYQAALRELSEETGLRFSENDLNISTLGLWEVQYSANFLGLSIQCSYNCNSLGCLKT